MVFDPAWITAGSSLLGTVGGLFGQRDQEALAQAQTDLGFRQFYAQQRLQRLQEELATASETDARGNTRRYIPGVGWVQDVTPTTRGLLLAEDQERRQQLTGDAVTARSIRNANAGRQVGEGAAAQQLFRRYMDNAGRSVPELQGNMIVSSLADARASMQRPMSALLAARQGIDRGGPSRIDGAQTSAILARAKLGAPSMANEEAGAAGQSRLNPYNLMATRASAPIDAAFNPSSISSELRTAGNMQNYLASNNMAGASRSLALGSEAPMKGFEALSRSQPNYGYAATAAGNSIAKMIELLARRQTEPPDRNVNRDSADSGFAF